MKILETSKPNMTAIEIYKMTKNPSIQKMRDICGASIQITDWVHYEDENQKGEVHAILSIRDAGGEVYATNSPTFIRSFFEIRDILSSCGEPLEHLEIIQGTSKNGRPFVTCAL